MCFSRVLERVCARTSQAARPDPPSVICSAHATALSFDGTTQSAALLKNTGGAPFSFTGALHSYWSVSSIDGIEIQGAFEGARYLDKVAGEEKTCATKALKIGAETDAVNGLGSNRETDAVADAQPTLPHSHTAPLLPRLCRCTRASAAT